MSLATRITRFPHPFEPDLGDDAAASLPWAGADLKTLIRGTAGSSPYLAQLLRREGAWLESVAEAEPEDALAALIDATEPGPVAETGIALRIAKRRVALLVALCDLGGVWGLDEVTAALTRFADRAVDTALRSVLIPEIARGRLPDFGASDAPAGLFALAMGKMGAHELNYSSDIDLICLFDDRLHAGADLPEARSHLVRGVRKAMGLLSDLTSEGYVFRTDLRLRPDPSVTPVAVSVSSAMRYYEALGRTWERAAFIKARPAAGAIGAGESFLHEISPFIWRRHLDFATVEDAHDLRRKIRLHKATGGPGLDGRNVKLGPGGIREIEFFAQTHQLISGGRDPDLRQRDTRGALVALVGKGWVKPDAAEVLDASYVRLREIEHRLQMLQDAQTHDLPSTEDGWRRLACIAGAPDAGALQQELGEIFERVHALTEGFFAPARSAPQPDLVLSQRSRELIEKWQSYPALRSQRAREIFKRLAPTLMTGFERAAAPDEAILQFDGFLRGLPAGVQLLSLFEANPQLIDLMVDISSTAPALASYLSANSGVLDAVIGGDFFAPWPSCETLAADLARILGASAGDYETQLDAARRWMKDWHFRIGVHHLRGLIPSERAAEQYSDLAEATVAALWHVVCDDFASRHGALPGRGAVVLAMGSFGARQLSARSDLDLILIYDADSDATSDGRRPLPARTYYARLTKALITALTTRTAEGALYEVDMRLRPSGRQGPAATSWQSYLNYQRDEAWTWEHLALTRARVVAGQADLGRDVEEFRRKLLAGPRDASKILGDLQDMRLRLAEAKPRADVWDVSNGPGGLQDIELFAQTVALLGGVSRREVSRQLAIETALASSDDRAHLLDLHRRLAAIKGAARLLTGDRLDPDAIGQGGRAFVLREAAAKKLGSLEQELEKGYERAAAIIAAPIAELATGATTGDD
jgi:glutamate-ammonia-ligase adenylyltransferase